MLKPLKDSGKPVVITEFGFNTTNQPVRGMANGLDDVSNVSRLLHALPGVGRFIRPWPRVIRPRDESAQADRLGRNLDLLESAGVEGAFVFTFTFPLNPFDEDPKFDLDRSGTSLVKVFSDGRQGTTYTDMPWEPKESFHAVAKWYLTH